MRQVAVAKVAIGASRLAHALQPVVLYTAGGWGGHGAMAAHVLHDVVYMPPE